MLFLLLFSTVTSFANRVRYFKAHFYYFSEKSSSSDSSSSPATLKKYVKAYTGAGSKTLQLYPSDEESDAENTSKSVLNYGWRKGQPPRSDVVVKFTNKKAEKQIVPEIKQTAAERVANKILVGPIHRIPKLLPQLKYGLSQIVETIDFEHYSNFQQKTADTERVKLSGTSICPDLITNHHQISLVAIKEAPLGLEKAEQETIDDFDPEVIEVMKDYFKAPDLAHVEQRSTPSYLETEVKKSVIDYKVAPKPVKVEPELVKIDPKPVNVATKPLQVVPELVKVALEPVKVAHELVKVAPEPVKIVNPFITPKLTNITEKPQKAIKAKSIGTLFAICRCSGT